jgi:aldose 1-epimerase
VKHDFGTTPDGDQVECHILETRALTPEGAPGDGGGVRARVLTYGATLQALEVPDGRGGRVNVVLGGETLDDYLRQGAYVGATVGRFGNRIAGARFTLDGVEHRLAANNGPNSLHGGERGFDKRVWRAEPLGPAALALSYVSPDGEEGYPGTLRVTVTYSLVYEAMADGVTPGHALHIDYLATTDAPTVLNLTNHSYFNLAAAGDVLGHVLTLAAERYLPVDERQIPTGELAPVAGTPFDFTDPHPVGERIGADDPQLRIGQGYDHCYVLGDDGGLAARVEDPETGRVMEVETTEPGVQLYTGNLLGEDAMPYGRHGGLCLETQHFPDSPNRPDFPSTVLRPGEEFRSHTVYRFA